MREKRDVKSKHERKESRVEKWLRLADLTNCRVAQFPLPKPTGSGNGVVQALDVLFYCAGPILLTAPHTLKLRRDDHPDHVSEPLVLDIVKLLTVEFGPKKASTIHWTPQAARNFSTNRDPNYLSHSELKTNPWHRFLVAHHQRHGPIALHYDFHGMNGKKHGSDLALGYESLRKFIRESPYQNLPRVLEAALKSVLSPHGFIVKEVPTLTGYRGKDRYTLSQQSVVTCKGAAIQIEMSMRLREALLNSDLRAQFGKALLSAYIGFLEPLADLRGTTVQQLRLQSAQQKRFCWLSQSEIPINSVDTPPSEKNKGQKVKGHEIVAAPGTAGKGKVGKVERRQARAKTEKILNNVLVRLLFCLPTLEKTDRKEEKQRRKQRIQRRLSKKTTVVPAS